MEARAVSMSNFIYTAPLLQHNVLRTENMSNVPPEGDTIYALLNSVFTSLFCSENVRL